MSLFPASDPWYIECLLPWIWSLLRPLIKKIVPFFWKPSLMGESIHLDQEHILRQIVQKFEFRAGTRFHRSSRGAKDFVDRAKTAWDFPTAALSYTNKTREPMIFEEAEQKYKNGPNFCADKLCRIDLIHIDDCDPNFFEETLLPEVAALGAVRVIILRGATLPDEGIHRLLAAAKPALIGIEDRYFDAEDDVFKHVKHLGIIPTHIGPYYTTKKLFEVARNRESLRLVYSFNKDVVPNFVENWLKGEPTGSLERLAIMQCYDKSWSTEDKIKYEDDICDFVNSFCQSPGDYVLKRGGLDLLKITGKINHPDYLYMAFLFS